MKFFRPKQTRLFLLNPRFRSTKTQQPRTSLFCISNLSQSEYRSYFIHQKKINIYFPNFFQIVAMKQLVRRCNSKWPTSVLSSHGDCSYDLILLKSLPYLRKCILSYSFESVLTKGSSKLFIKSPSLKVLSFNAGRTGCWDDQILYLKNLITANRRIEELFLELEEPAGSLSFIRNSYDFFKSLNLTLPFLKHFDLNFIMRGSQRSYEIIPDSPDRPSDDHIITFFGQGISKCLNLKFLKFSVSFSVSLTGEGIAQFGKYISSIEGLQSLYLDIQSLRVFQFYSSLLLSLEEGINILIESFSSSKSLHNLFLPYLCQSFSSEIVQRIMFSLSKISSLKHLCLSFSSETQGFDNLTGFDSMITNLRNLESLEFEMDSQILDLDIFHKFTNILKKASNLRHFKWNFNPLTSSNYNQNDLSKARMFMRPTFSLPFIKSLLSECLKSFSVLPKLNSLCLKSPLVYTTAII